MDPRKMEKRRAQRAHVRFVVAVDALGSEDPGVRDVSQTKNISLGGMLLTTSTALEPNARFCLKVRLPARLQPVEIEGQVLDSRLATGQVYDTRVQFVQLRQEADRQILTDTINYFLRRESLKN